MMVMYLLILICLIVYYMSRPAPDRKQKCRVAKAGDVNHVSPLISTINDLSNKTFNYNGENVNFRDYEIFIVDGESMARCGIHTGDGVLVSRLFDKCGMNNGTVVIYEIDPNRYINDNPDVKETQYGYKIRQFLAYADLNKSNQDIYESIKNVDLDLGDISFKELLLKKIDKARKYFSNQIVTISITYKGDEKDYSIHSFSELYGIVKYVIPESYMKNN